MTTCIIVDDEQHAIDLLTSHVAKVPWLNIKYFTIDPIDALQYVLKNRVDLIFLDIQMPELNGFQFLKLIKGKSKVILTTAYPEHALEGYEHDIVDYLLKPIVFDRFLKSVQKAMDVLGVIRERTTTDPKNDVNEYDFVLVKLEGRKRLIKVLLKDIEYIESLGNYLSIHTAGGRIMTLLTIRELEEKLAGHSFIRIHNSYLASVNKITEIRTNQIQIGDRTLPIGDVYRKSFFTFIDKYLLKGKSQQ